MRKIVKYLFLGAVVGLLSLQFLPNPVKALSSATYLTTEGSPTKAIPSQLAFSIPNGTSVVFRETQSFIDDQEMGDNPYNATGTGVGYELNSFSNVNKTDTSNTVIIQSLNNITNTISPYINFADFGNPSTSVNVTRGNLISLMRGCQFFFPSDVSVSDLFGNDTSFYQAEYSLLDQTNGNLTMYTDFLNGIVNNLTLIIGGNITIYKNTPTTKIATSDDGMSGNYTYDNPINVTLNEVDSGGDNNLKDLSALIDETLFVNASMNEYHIINHLALGFGLMLHLQDLDVSNQTGFMMENSTFGLDLVYSSLIPMTPMQQAERFIDMLTSQWYYTVALVGIIAGSVVVIWLAVQRSRCSKVDETARIIGVSHR